MMAVWGIGRPSGCLSNTTTAYQMGEAADRGCLREGSKNADVRIATLQELREDEDRKARGQDTVSEKFRSA